MAELGEIKGVIREWQDWYRKTELNCFSRDVSLSMPQDHALVLIGVRRAGKSFAAVNFIKEKNARVFCMNFEDPLFTMESDVSILDKLISVFVEYNGFEPEYILFDEIQNITSWERWVRKIVDLKKYKMILTGSSAKLLSSEIASSLTGRGIERRIWPLSFREFIEFTGAICKTENEHLAAMNEYIKFGAFPEIVLTKDDDQKIEILRQYLTDIVTKDIVNRYQIRSKRTLDQLVVFYLTHVSTLQSYNSYKNSFEVNIETVRDYTKYMEECFLMFEVNRFHPSQKIQARDNKKIYAIDTGLRNFNCPSSYDADLGRLAENVVFVELKRRGKEIFYFKEKYEVDFVLTEFGKPKELIQVCYSDLKVEDTFNRETRALIEAIKSLKLDEGTMLTRNRTDILNLEGKKVKLLPLYEWLLDSNFVTGVGLPNGS